MAQTLDRLRKLIEANPEVFQELAMMRQAIQDDAMDAIQALPKAAMEASARNAQSVSNLTKSASESPAAMGLTDDLLRVVSDLTGSVAKNIYGSRGPEDGDSMVDAVERKLSGKQEAPYLGRRYDIEGAAQPAPKAAPSKAAMAEMPAEEEGVTDMVGMMAGEKMTPVGGDEEMPASFTEKAPAPKAAAEPAADVDVNALFEVAHGTPFDPKSSMDKQKMAQIQELLKKTGGAKGMTPNQFAIQLYREYDYV